MYEFEYSSQFKKDYKLMKRRGADMELISTVLGFLEQYGQVPREYLPHVLSGKYKGIWECHISPDWLLLYTRSDKVRLVRLVRTGTHSDVFKK